MEEQGFWPPTIPLSFGHEAGELFEGGGQGREQTSWLVLAYQRLSPGAQCLEATCGAPPGPAAWPTRVREGESEDSLYSHLFINGGHHHHLTRLIDPQSLQGLCCVSISYWLFQVYSYWVRPLPSNHCSPLSDPPRDFFKQSFEIIIYVSKCHNCP